MSAVPEFAQPLHERRKPLAIDRSRGSAPKNPMAREFRRLLRARRERPHRHAAPSMMNSRRFIDSPQVKEDTLPHRLMRRCCASQQNLAVNVFLRVISLEGNRGRSSMHFRYSPKS